MADGFQRFVRVLDEHYQYLPETELLEALDSFLYGVVRAPRQGATEFSAQFRTALSRLSSLPYVRWKASGDLLHHTVAPATSWV